MSAEIQTFTPEIEPPGESLDFHPVQYETRDGTIVEGLECTPELVNHEAPTILAGGLTEGPEVLTEVVKGLAASGRRVVVLDQPRFETGKNSDDVVKQRAGLIEAAIAEEDGPVDIVAHSLGFIDAVVASRSVEPGKVQSIVGVASAGLLEGDTFKDLAGRYTRETFGSTGHYLPKQETRAPFVRSQSVGAKYIADRPGRYFAEARATADTVVHSPLEELIDNGTEVAILQSNNDAVFPPKRVDATLPEGITNAYLIDKKARHNEVHVQARTSSEAIVQLLDQSEDHHYRRSLSSK